MTTAENRATPAEFFAWKRHPFADTYRLKQPFIPQADQRLLRCARELLALGKSFALCGPSGVGKTTLIHHLVEQLDARHYRPFFIPYGGYNRGAILRVLAEAMGLDPASRRTPLLCRIHQQIQQLAQGQQPQFPIFLVDDAQWLERPSLLDLCALIALPSHNTVAAAIILIGDESLPKLLGLRIMAPVSSRLATIFDLPELSEEDCHRFLEHRLQSAEAAAELFDRQAATLIAAAAGGNRRQLMNLATLLLQDAFARGERTVSAQLVLGSPLLKAKT